MLILMTTVLRVMGFTGGDGGEGVGGMGVGKRDLMEGMRYAGSCSLITPHLEPQCTLYFKGRHRLVGCGSGIGGGVLSGERERGHMDVCMKIIVS